MENNYPCICGHDAIKHRGVIPVGKKKGKVYCRACFDEQGGSFANWHEYVKDNLKYLEQEYDSHNRKLV